jgi:hypothetical protein
MKRINNLFWFITSHHTPHGNIRVCHSSQDLTEFSSEYLTKVLNFLELCIACMSELFMIISLRKPLEIYQNPKHKFIYYLVNNLKNFIVSKTLTLCLLYLNFTTMSFLLLCQFFYNNNVYTDINHRIYECDWYMFHMIDFYSSYLWSIMFFIKFYHVFDT